MALSAERLRALEEALELVVALRRSVETAEIVQRDLDALLSTSNDEPSSAEERRAPLIQEKPGMEPSKALDQVPVENPLRTMKPEGQFADRTEPVSPERAIKAPPPVVYDDKPEPRAPVSQNPTLPSQPKHGLKSKLILLIAKIIGRARPSNERRIR